MKFMIKKKKRLKKNIKLKEEMKNNDYNEGKIKKKNEFEREEKGNKMEA